jgi:hypothetical protein
MKKGPWRSMDRERLSVYVVAKFITTPVISSYGEQKRKMRKKKVSSSEQRKW